MDNGNRRRSGEPSGAADTLIAEVSARMAVVIDLFETKAMAAKAARMSREQLMRQAGGKNRPFFDSLVRLCHVHGVSLDWLATGEGPMFARDRVADSTSAQTVEPVDLALLQNLVTGLERFLHTEELELDPDDKGRLVVLLYQLLAGRRREAGQAAPIELRESGHPVDIGRDVILSGIVRIAG